MKGLIALAALAVLSGCSSFKSAAPADPWTRWVCDSKAEVTWRYADAARKAVDVRLNQSEQVFHLQAEPGAAGELFGNGVLSFARNGDEGLVYWSATNDLIGRGCKAR
ncbi:MliC family protein [Pseudomonas sp. 21LCFQ02]|uniref:MliC family protein n=1 Tax=unclassified Pseudomonas TaxID=196821 RepID=UPI0004F7DDBB|nr:MULTISPECIES: MliC family protein [unclassified Pseudomonas]MCO8161701.1 MliC family protein [Pseudomonas sp. 21LCFQ010]MCO8167544.1 MliC family protein [Pseudomonas sp. 21LCFQ02]MCQ9424362.1 MliC family protein [Pseudomonas sp. LJDD11]BAP42836.1 lipoprotein [Pseudomonas sp. StFLB209]